MAEGKDNKMSLIQSQPEIEWSTREKLAIASYVARSGEQHWSGAGRLLRPLGEPGRPPEWFSPKFCAQQYTALMEQANARKRKRVDRSDSSESVQPEVSPEEAVISRLTKERIEELKKQVRYERTEYRKLNREIDMIESGQLDDKLDELFKEINKIDDSDEEKEQEAAHPEPRSEETQIDVNETETISSSTVEPNEDSPKFEVINEKLTPDAVKEIETNEDDAPENVPSTSNLTKEDAEKMEIATEDESQDTQPVISVSEERPSTIAVESNAELTIEAASTADDQTMEVVTEQPMDTELNVDDASENQDKLEVVSDKASAVTTDMPLDEKENATANEGENIVTKENNNAIEPDPGNAEKETTKTVTSIAESKSVDSEVQDSTPVVEEAKQSTGSPCTPAPSFSYDSTFPSSPALSHSSDVDPETAASNRAWKKSIMILWKQVASHRYASIFLQPVTDEIAPNYSTTVYRSTDLATIKKNIENGILRTTSEFRRDIMLMFQNALMYNSAEHDVYKWTLEMQKDFIDQIAQFIATQMMVETAQLPDNKSLRRSTMRRSVLSEKSSQSTRSRRSAAATDSDSKSSH